MDFPDKLDIATPCCDRKVKPVTFYTVATDVVQRTCPACRQRYVVVIKPMIKRHPKLGRAAVHVLDWNPVTK